MLELEPLAVTLPEVVAEVVFALPCALSEPEVLFEPLDARLPVTAKVPAVPFEAMFPFTTDPSAVFAVPLASDPVPVSGLTLAVPAKAALP